MRIRRYAQRLWERRLVICRVRYQLEVVGGIVGLLVYLTVCGLAPGGSRSLLWAGVVVVSNLIVNFATSRWFRGSSWHKMRLHWTHDEDCTWGPKESRGKATARLRTWVKVALRPGFVGA